MTIKTLVFDLDDTLLWDKKSISEAFRLTCEHAKAQTGIDAGLLEKAVREAAAKLYASYPTHAFTQQIGINPFEGLWAQFDESLPVFSALQRLAPRYRNDAWHQGLQACGIENWQLAEACAAYFITMRRQSPFLYEDSLSVLAKLQARYQLVLLTNGSPSLQNEKLRLTPELVPFFESIIISGDIGYGKPDSRLFEHLLATLAIEATETVMIGDNLMTDILGANRSGMQSIWLNREAKPSIEGITPTYTVTTLTALLEIV